MAVSNVVAGNWRQLGHQYPRDGLLVYFGYPTALGETLNIAARLEALAQRNGIVIGPLTKELCGHVFECEDIDAHELTGVSDAVNLWRVIGMHASDRRRRAQFA